jgi:6-phospho-3-hexuloisomerase
MNIDKYCKTILKEAENTLGKVDSKSYYALVDLILDSKRIFLSGAGRSGLMIKAFAIRLTQLGIENFVVGAVSTPAIGKGDLLLIGSASGETSSLVIIGKKAKKYDAKVALITAYNESKIAKFADFLVSLPASSPKVKKIKQVQQSVQQLGTLFEQSLLIFLDIIVRMLMNRTKKTSNEMYRCHANLE